MTVEIDLWSHAQAYVGNANEAYHMAGICQLEILKHNGLRPHHHVLEIGCGALVAGRPLIQYLEPDRYVGIEPNSWLVNAARIHFPDMNEWFSNKRPIFLDRTDFDALEAGRKFDFVLSHSVLSHAPHWQLPQFFAKVAPLLNPYGTIIASLRMYDENGAAMGDSLHETWQYPGVTYFSINTILREAHNVDLKAEHIPEYRTFFARHVPSNVHDWIRAKRRWTFGTHMPPPSESLYGKPSPSGREQEERSSPEDLADGSGDMADDRWNEVTLAGAERQAGRTAALLEEINKLNADIAAYIEARDFWLHTSERWETAAKAASEARPPRLISFIQAGYDALKRRRRPQA